MTGRNSLIIADFNQVDLKSHPASHESPQKNKFLQSNSSSHWVTVGDLHGNPLKLLHFLLLNRVAFLSEESYLKFVRIYLEVNQDPTRLQNHLTSIQAILEEIIIDPKGHLCFLGDMLADRGPHDYLTLILMEKLIDNLNKEGGLEILLSNHDASFIESHYSEDPYDYLYGESYRSKHSLHHALESGLTTQERIDALFDKFKKFYKLVSYELNADGQVKALFTHAPSSVSSVIESAYGLLLRSHQFAYDHVKKIFVRNRPKSSVELMTQSQSRRLEALLRELIPGFALSKTQNNAEHLKIKNLKVEDRQLAQLIDLLNEICAMNAHQHSLHELIGLGFDEPTCSGEYISLGEVAEFGNGYNLRADVFPIHALLWAREVPVEKAILSHQLHYFNGHDDNDEGEKLPNRTSLNSMFGFTLPSKKMNFFESRSIYVENQIKHIQHVQIISDGERPKPYFDHTWKNTPLSADRKKPRFQQQIEQVFSNKRALIAAAQAGSIAGGASGVMATMALPHLFSSIGEVVLKSTLNSFPLTVRLMLSIFSGLSCALFFVGVASFHAKTYTELAYAALAGFAVGMALTFEYAGVASILMPMATTAVPTLGYMGYLYNKQNQATAEYYYLDPIGLRA